LIDIGLLIALKTTIRNRAIDGLTEGALPKQQWATMGSECQLTLHQN